MDQRFTVDELAFRDELRAFIRDNLPEDIRERMRLGYAPRKEDTARWQRILNERGWSAYNWPKEYGGPGWTPVQRMIFLEENQLAPAPEVSSFNITMIGPVLIQFGTEEQKQRFLPRAANIDDWWCQGFSEPGAGSDLASLKTAAKRDRDDYIVNGQKIWTSTAHHADWCFCLVRTDPQAKKRQEGISFLLIDMKTPGITVRPIISIDGSHHLNEVFFDDVRVPVSLRVGEENRGWDVAKFLLGHGGVRAGSRSGTVFGDGRAGRHRNAARRRGGAESVDVAANCRRRTDPGLCSWGAAVTLRSDGRADDREAQGQRLGARRRQERGSAWRQRAAADRQRAQFGRAGRSRRHHVVSRECGSERRGAARLPDARRHARGGDFTERCRGRRAGRI